MSAKFLPTMSSARAACPHYRCEHFTRSIQLSKGSFQFIPFPTFQNSHRCDKGLLRPRAPFPVSLARSANARSISFKPARRSHDCHVVQIKCLQSGSGSIKRNDEALTGPEVIPDAKFSPVDVVTAQLTALKTNDMPRPDHGLEVAYSFVIASESILESNGLSKYFGFTADLYHFGHFALKFRTRYKDLIDLKAFEVEDVTPASEPQWMRQVKATITSNKGAKSVYCFFLRQVQGGRLDNCWLVDQLLPFES
eukprot:jgi/Mesvir1/21282/Mv21677-RA.1